MQNFVLNNGVVLKTIPPITFPNNMSKTRTICFQTDLPYDVLFEMFSEYSNVCRIECKFDSGNVADVLTDCVKLKVLSRKDDGSYTAEFSTDATEKLILELQEEVKRLKSQVENLIAEKESDTSEETERPDVQEPGTGDEETLDPEAKPEEPEIPDEETETEETDDEENFEP